MSAPKPNKTICIDHDITEIVEQINAQGGKLSPVVCNLLRFYRDNDYRIPAMVAGAAPAAFDMDENEAAEIRAEQGLDG